MKKFKWKLQRLLDVRAKQEQLKKIELAEINQKLAMVKAELMMQKIILKDALDSLSKESPADRLARQAMFMTSSARNNEIIKNLQLKQKDIEVQQQEKIAEVMKLRQLREGLEKLCQDARISFIREQKKQEQAAMDEASTSKFARNMISQRQGSLAV